ncbi:DUF3054 domain-containing protein [Natrinema sp. 1APR25-10V2]|uniref:DUF3054 domain-containing protein n=1 Tax=Natrinema sp. 1APR25-10V2 TaxID=2951081 RepID=UPI002876693B|nr:DUF3054 domain-containing protein [Natrinema sp. 1APR25-10V2]MDS0477445.1 DUF3054 domain-containing protein [Natrinema sp. 1APR25-10V2]
MIESRLRPNPVGRIAAEPSVVALAVADAVVVTAFLAFGLFTHGIEPWAYPAHTLRTATPFVLAWATVAPPLGAYRRRALESFGRTVAVVGVAWLAATVLGGAIRASSFFPGGAPPSFLLVNAAVGLAFVLPWRLAVTGGRRVWR